MIRTKRHNNIATETQRTQSFIVIHSYSLCELCVSVAVVEAPNVTNPFYFCTFSQGSFNGSPMPSNLVAWNLSP